MLKLVSVNIEGDKHHDTAIPFLKNEAPDIVCLQEIFQDDVSQYEHALVMKSFFKPACRFPAVDGRIKMRGSAIFSRHEADFHFRYIVGSESDVPVFSRPADPLVERNTTSVVLLWADIRDHSGRFYRIGNIHFTWTPEGLSTAYQKEDAAKLVTVLDHDVQEFILTGDLNAPRGGETFSILSMKYKDNIPGQYDSSIDPKLHRVPGLVRMVDVLFSTPEYEVTNVRLQEGVSDHKAVIGYIEKI